MIGVIAIFRCNANMKNQMSHDKFDYNIDIPTPRMSENTKVYNIIKGQTRNVIPTEIVVK